MEIFFTFLKQCGLQEIPKELERILVFFFCVCLWHYDRTKPKIHASDFLLPLQFTTFLAIVGHCWSWYKSNFIGIEIILTMHQHFFLLQKFVSILCHIYHENKRANQNSLKNSWFSWPVKTSLAVPWNIDPEVDKYFVVHLLNQVYTFSQIAW